MCPKEGNWARYNPSAFQMRCDPGILIRTATKELFLSEGKEGNAY